MSKKPLISEGVARRWAKYAGIQNESRVLLETIYEEDEEQNDDPYASAQKSALNQLGSDDDRDDDATDEAALMSELEELLAEEDYGDPGLFTEQEDEEDEEDEEDDMEDMEDMDDEDMEDDDMEDMEDMEDEEDEEEMDMEDEEADEEAAGGMDQQAVEDAVKAGLEAMASAIGDALKIKIDVRSGEEIEPEPEAEEGGEEEIMEMGNYGSGMEEEAASGMFESMDRDELVERVMKRVAARLVRESKRK
ncbi:MAG: hypothetical protein VW683_07730 [Betaproteobacteria bacterium]